MSHRHGLCVSKWESEPPVSSAIPLLYCLYRVGIATFHSEQHSLQHLATLLEYAARDDFKHPIGANLMAYTHSYLYVLVSSEMKSTHLVQMKSGYTSASSPSKVMGKLGFQDTPQFPSAAEPSHCLFCFGGRHHLGHSQEV